MELTFKSGHEKLIQKIPTVKIRISPKHLLSARGKLRKLNESPLPEGGSYLIHLVLFESVFWLPESYLMLFGIIYKLFCYILKKCNAKVICFLHKTACKKQL